MRFRGRNSFHTAVVQYYSVVGHSPSLIIILLVTHTHSVYVILIHCYWYTFEPYSYCCFWDHASQPLHARRGWLARLGPNKLKLGDVQTRLNQCGLTSLIVKLITSTQHNTVMLETVKLAVALLIGGHRGVQVRGERGERERE